MKIVPGKKDYKAVRLHGQVTASWFQDNAALVKWVLAQPLASPLVCLDDGYDGIWHIIKQLALLRPTTRNP